MAVPRLRQGALAQRHRREMRAGRGGVGSVASRSVVPKGRNQMTGRGSLTSDESKAATAVTKNSLARRGSGVPAAWPGRRTLA